MPAEGKEKKYSTAVSSIRGYSRREPGLITSCKECVLWMVYYYIQGKSYCYIHDRIVPGSSSKLQADKDQRPVTAHY
jgi:hypothetical protein